MIFLIEYDRPRGALVSLETFEDSQQHGAERLRLRKELELNARAQHHEVVLLQAENEDAIRRTHMRYFMSASQIIASFTG